MNEYDYKYHDYVYLTMNHVTLSGGLIIHHRNKLRINAGSTSIDFSTAIIFCNINHLSNKYLNLKVVSDWSEIDIALCILCKPESEGTVAASGPFFIAR